MHDSQPSFHWIDQVFSTADVDSADVVGNIEVIERAYREGLFGGTVHEVFPDIDRSSREWRSYFTMPCAINYQRQSESLWRAALKTFSDPDTRFVFDCRSVVHNRDQYKSALSKHGLAVQRDKHTDIWYTIAMTFSETFDGDPLNLFSHFSYDIGQIKEYVLSRKKAFPYLGGPKLLNYWLYMQNYFTDIPFTNRFEISVIPDLHVKRASVALGLLSESESANTDLVAETWDKLLRGTRFAPADLHAPLWRWSRAGMPAIEILEDKLRRVEAART